MSWREDLQPASFRGAPFEVESTGERGGRRLAIHEYPQTEIVEAEDLGQGPRRFSIDAFVLGEDYMSARDALIRALDQPGAAELVHPYRGRLQVIAEDWSCEESKKEGGSATFRIIFLRDDAVQRPSAEADTGAAVAQAADEARAASADQFSSAYLVATASDGEYGLQSMLDKMAPVAAAVQQVRDVADGVQLKLLRAILDPVAGARSLLRNIIGLPGELSSRLQGLVGHITNAADLSALFDRAPALRLPAGRPTANDQAMQQLLRVSIAAQQAQQSSVTAYASYDDAIATLARITEQLDSVAYGADDATAIALQDLRTAVALDLQSRAADLARVSRYTPGETLPALVVAHRLYGPAAVGDRADELVARNRLAHPGFVPGGRPLEVLTP